MKLLANGISYALLLTALLTGCAHKPVFIHPQLDKLSGTLSTYGIIPPRIEVYEVDAAGRAVLNDEWSKLAVDNVSQVIVETFRQKSIVVRPVAIDEAILRQAAQTAVVKDSYDPLEKRLPKIYTDALIIVEGYDQVPTAETKALRTALLAAKAPQVPEETFVRIRIVASDGTMLWQDERSHPKIGYERSIKGATEAVKETFLLKPLWKTYGENVFDLRDKEKTAKFIQSFLGDFFQLIK